MRKQTISFFIFLFVVFAVNASIPAPKLFTGFVSPLVVEPNVAISAHYEYSGKKVGKAAWDIAKSPYALGNAAGTLMFDSNAREELIERLALAKELFERYKNDPCFRDEVNKKLGKEAADYFSDPDKISDLLITGGTGILAGAGVGAASKSAKAEQMLQKLSRLMKKMGGKGAKGTTALSPYRVTAPGETFIRYESGNPAFTRITPTGGVKPGTFAAPASEGIVPVPERVPTYNLPSPEIPRPNAISIKPPPGTPIIGPRPVSGGTGNEVIFWMGY